MSRSTPSRKLSRWCAGLIALTLIVGATLAWGGGFLVDVDPPPERAHAIVVLRGSTESSLSRLDGAARLLQSGVAEQLLLSVAIGSHWGEPIPDMARRYVDRVYGPEAAEHYVVCASNADSTGEEALALMECLARRGWQNVVVVTSDYHTRRAKLIWRAVAQGADPPMQVSVVGVPDPEFEAQGWWRKRRYAKTWLLEMQKLVWYFMEGVPDHGPEGLEY